MHLYLWWEPWRQLRCWSSQSQPSQPHAHTPTKPTEPTEPTKPTAAKARSVTGSTRCPWNVSQALNLQSQHRRHKSMAHRATGGEFSALLSKLSGPRGSAVVSALPLHVGNLLASLQLSWCLLRQCLALKSAYKATGAHSSRDCRGGRKRL